MLRVAAILLALAIAGAPDAWAQEPDDGWIGADELAAVVDSFRVDPGTVRVQLSRVPVSELVSLEFNGTRWPDLASVRMTRSSGLLVLPYAIHLLAHDPDLQQGLVMGLGAALRAGAWAISSEKAERAEPRGPYPLNFA